MWGEKAHLSDNVINGISNCRDDPDTWVGTTLPTYGLYPPANRKNNENKKVFLFKRKTLIVGVNRLERSTPCTPCKCASQLRHTPIIPGYLPTFTVDPPDPGSGCASQWSLSRSAGPHPDSVPVTLSMEAEIQRKNSQHFGYSNFKPLSNKVRYMPLLIN